MARKGEQPKVMLLRVPKGFEAASEYDFERLERYANGSVVEAQFWQRRSLPRHRLYWAIMRIVAENNERWQTEDAVHENIKFALGYVKPVTLFDGERILAPGSTAFDAMDEGDFKIYFDLAMQLIRLHFRFDIDELIERGQRKIGFRPYHGEGNGKQKPG